MNSKLLPFCLALCLFACTPAEPDNQLNRQTKVVDGKSVSYVEHAGDGPTLVLLHSNSCSADVFANQLSGQLNNRVIALEFPGHGESEYNENALSSPENLATWFRECLAELNAQDAIVVGNSLGAHVAMWHEHLFADSEVQGLVLFGTAPFNYVGNQAQQVRSAQHTMSNAYNGQNEIIAQNIALKADITDEERMSWAHNTVLGDEKRKALAIIFGTADPRVRAHFNELMSDPAGLIDEESLLREIDKPVLYMHGEKQMAVRLTQITDRVSMHNIWGNQVHLISDASHNPQWEAPEEFNQLISEFAHRVSDSNPHTWKTSEIDVDGGTLHVREYGEGEPVLLLAGGPGFSGDYMESTAREMASYRYVVVPDQRGTGLSTNDEPANLTLEQYLDDLESIRMELDIVAWDIVGHSWGGMYAMAYAKAHPDRVNRIALVSSGGTDMSFEQPMVMSRFALLTPEDSTAFMEQFQNGEIMQAFQTIMPAYCSDDRFVPELKTYVCEEYFSIPTYATLWADLQANYNLEEDMGVWFGNTVHIHGDRDFLVPHTREQLTRTLEGLVDVQIDSCGHFPMIEKSERFNEEIRAFLEYREE